MTRQQNLQGKNPDQGGRWGILGGLFDPIHNGHISLAVNLIRSEILDGVLFVPAAKPPHKTNERRSDFNIRMTMLSIALGDHDNLIPCDIEKTDNLSGYTLDTVRAIKKRYPSSQFCFIIGADNIEDIPNWYRYKEIFDLVDLIAGTRGGVVPDAPAESESLPIKYVELPPVTAASSEIRQMVAAGTSLESLTRYVPEKVARFIIDQKLYL